MLIDRERGGGGGEEEGPKLAGAVDSKSEELEMRVSGDLRSDSRHDWLILRQRYRTLFGHFLYNLSCLFAEHSDWPPGSWKSRLRLRSESKSKSIARARAKRGRRKRKRRMEKMEGINSQVVIAHRRQGARQIQRRTSDHHLHLERLSW